MSDQLTEQEIVEATPVDVILVGSPRKLQIRQPMTAEYDDALVLMGVIETKWRRRAELADTDAVGCSDAERASITASIERLGRQIAELPKDSIDERRGLKVRQANLLNEMETRTLADESATDRALLARDRYLVRVLLIEDGEQVVKSNEDWERLPLVVKNACRPAIWKALSAYENAPFV